jgi:transposase
MRLWTEKHRKWVWSLTFALAPQQATLSDYATEVDHARDRVLGLEKAIEAAIATAPSSMRAVIEALQSMRGVSQLVAVTVVAEVGELSRFEHPRQLMGYSGAVPSEHSSGGKTQRGAITKTGNSHLRRVLVEGAWSYRHRPRIIGELRKRQEGLSDKVKAIAWKAQERLCARYRKLSAKGKVQQNVVTAIAREMLGFMWAIGVEVERLHASSPPINTAAA